MVEAPTAKPERKRYMGHIDGMPADHYHAAAGYSRSQLADIADTPMDYWYKHESGLYVRPEADDDLVLGTACHSAILEPDLYRSGRVVMPPLNLRTKAGREERDAFVEEHRSSGKLILTVEQDATAMAVRDAVFKHPRARQLFRSGRAEQTYFAIDPETGELVKCRTDWECEVRSLIVDVKTARSASPQGVQRAISEHLYQIQPPWYLDVIEAANAGYYESWIFLFVEKKPPYKLGIYPVGQEMMERGRRYARTLFNRILECKRTGEWPDYGYELREARQAPWDRTGLVS